MKCKRSTLIASAIAVAFFATACADPFFDDIDPATLAGEEDAKEWQDSSAPGMVLGVQTQVLFVVGAIVLATEQEGEECPSLDESDGVLTITGGCTTEEGFDVKGSVVIHHADDLLKVLLPGGMGGISTHSSDVASIEANDFRVTGTKTCNEEEYQSSLRIDGRMTVRESGSDRVESSLHLFLENVGVSEENGSCKTVDERVAIDYEADVRLENPNEDGYAQRSSWNGSGRAGNDDTGWANLETADELIDVTECVHTPLSGKTTIESQGTEIRIEYIGEETCEMEAEARWYLDGEEKGLLTGVNCATAGGGQGAALLVLLAAGGLALLRGRRIR